MTLKSFPRGGKKPLTNAPANFLFDKKEKVKEKKTRNRKIEHEQGQEEDVFVPKTVQSLTYRTLNDGMIVLGRVHKSDECEISVALPGRLNGYIQAINISESYTNLLQSLVQSPDNHPPEFKSLPELYKRGDYIVCYVKRTDLDGKRRVSLSVEPELINQCLDPAKLQKGSKIACTISSIEEHGYAVDTGIKILRGFLAHKDIDDGVQYYPGQQIFCAIKNVKSTENIITVKLSTKSKHTTSTAAFDRQPLDGLNPGIHLDLSIKKVLSNGLQVTFNEKNVGYINQLYLKKPLTSYEQGTDIVGTLLYVLPTVKLAYFSELTHEKEEMSIKAGEVIPKAKVLFRESNGIVLRLMKGIRGFVSFKRTGVSHEDIPSKFAPQSVHRCRVLTYDVFDRVYVCTMEQQMLKEISVVSENVNIGDVMTIEIERFKGNTGWAFVRSGRTFGDVAPEHIIDVNTDPQEKPKIGDKLQARVVSRNKQDNGWLFTLKKSLVQSQLPILSDINQATVGSKHEATIIRITKQGLLVSFFNNVNGFIPTVKLNKKTGGAMNYIVGQVVLVKIDKINKEEGRLYLSIVSKDKGKEEKGSKLKIGQSVEGTVTESSIEGVYLRISSDDGAETVTGFLPAGHMAPCTEIGTYLSARYVPGDTLSALIFSTSPELILTRTFVPQEKYTDLHNLHVGDSLPCSIKEISATGLKVILPVNGFESYGIVPFNKADNIEALSPYQVLFGKITNVNKKEQKIYLSTSLLDIWADAVKHDAEMVATVDVLTLYLSKLKELSTHQYYKSKTISSIHLGQRVSGIVDKVTEHGLVLKLENDVTGTVRPAHYKSTFKAGDKVNGTVIWVNYIHELVEVTLLPALANSISSKQSKLPEVSVETQLRGEIVLVTNWFILAVLKGQGKGTLVALPSRSHTNDMQPDLSSYTIGKKIRCYVVLNKNESELLPVCLIKAVFDSRKEIIITQAKSLKRKIGHDDDDLLIKRLTAPKNPKGLEKYVKKETEMKSDTDAAPEHIEKVKQSKKIKRKREEDEEQQGSKDQKVKNKVTSVKDETHEVEETKKTKKKRIEKDENEQTKDRKSTDKITPIRNEKVNDVTASLSIPECGFFWDTKPDLSLSTKDESSSESEDDEEDQSKQKKKKKLNAAERRKLERQKEREIREREEALASNQTPNSVDQFDRLVLASPDSSIVWLQYMAFHLQATEIEKARAVAKRALKTINFREESEKLNVWQAWLNLESRFGSPETLSKVFYEAVNANSPMKIYLHMLTVHADAGRQAELVKTVRTVTGKFKHIPKAWIECGAALLQMGLKEKSRFAMQRAIQSLPTHEHVSLIVKFAQLENKFGDRERAQTLFEQILTSYPKRVDIWAIYIDLLVKSGDLDTARQVLEKAVVQTLPPRKMKTLFKKFISFEEQHGTPEGVAHAKELAIAYVEKQCTETN